MSANPRDRLQVCIGIGYEHQILDSETIEKEFANVLDASISTIGTSISGTFYMIWHEIVGLNSEYKHLDELHKMMILKLKDIHQQIEREGNEWFNKRGELRSFFSTLRDT